MEIYKNIKRLIEYGIKNELIESQDEIYVRNRVLDILGIDEYIDIDILDEKEENLQSILDNILDYAFKKGILEDNTITYRDLLDSKIMDAMMSKPSEIRNKFYEFYKISPKHATLYLYSLSKSSNYIRTERIKKNINWKSSTDYGNMDITINLSKPEKDPKAIAKALSIKTEVYPKCLLCKENEGYAGRVNHPARNNHRVIPLTLCGEEWFFQYSPYVYYNEHCIVFKGTHEPMRITRETFCRLLEFVSKFPHYFIGSNADLPIVGGSILTHDHFQGGCYSFAMESAKILHNPTIEGFSDIDIAILKWPMSVIRLRGEKIERIVELSTIILESWRDYDDLSVGIIKSSDGEPHNTITPIVRYKNARFEMDLVLRNNRTDNEHPLGIFHPHSDVHHIKKENIGLIEVMGLAVLPDRLVGELNLIKKCLLDGENFLHYEEISKHKDWFYYLKDKYIDKSIDIDEFLRHEIGRKFEKVLCDAGVFKQDEKGQAAFLRFIESI